MTLFWSDILPKLVPLALLIVGLGIVSPAAWAKYNPPEQDPPRGGTTTSGMGLAESNGNKFCKESSPAWDI